jgi:hypothetical protein
MVTAEHDLAPDTLSLGEVAEVLRLLAKQAGDNDGGQLGETLAAVAAELDLVAEQAAAQPGVGARGSASEIRCLRLKARQLRWLAWTGDKVISAKLLKLGKEMEAAADQRERAASRRGAARRPFAVRWTGGLGSAMTAPSLTLLGRVAAPATARATGVLRARRAVIAGIGVALVIGLAAGGAYRWLFPVGASPIDQTAMILGPRAAPVPPPSLALTAPPEPALPPSPPIKAVEPPPSVPTIAPPPPAAAVTANLLAAGILSRQRQQAKASAPVEPKPRHVTLTPNPAEAPLPTLRQLDLAPGNRAADGPSRPPIDAVDLPPPEQAVARPLAAPPAAASARPIPPAAPAEAPAAAKGASGLPECVPYTSDRTLDGRSAPVQGLTCRDANGQWRRWSEVPRPQP